MIFNDIQGGEMCHFPFKYLNKTYTSCAHINITNFNLKGEPWCATEVESDGITVKEHKWSLCQDERTIIVDGDGKTLIRFGNMVSLLFTNKYIIQKSYIQHFGNWNHILLTDKHYHRYSHRSSIRPRNFFLLLET